MVGMRKSIVSAAVGLLLGFGVVPAQALIISFQPSNLTISVGDSFSLDMLVTTEASEAILGFDFDLIFDDTQVDYIGVGAYGTDWIEAPRVDPVEDGVAALAVDFFDGVSGADILMATLDFECIGCGVSEINTGIISDFLGQEGIQLTQLAGGALLKDWPTEPAVITQVPEPGTLSLMLLGLLGLAGGAGLAGRRRLWRPDIA